MNDRGEKGRRLRFEDAPQEVAPLSCGQNVHNSSPAPPAKPRRRLRFEEDAADGSLLMEDTSPTCGQNVHNSKAGGKLRQDEEKARPSDRLRQNGEAPPPDGATADPDSDGAPGSGPRPTDKKAAWEGKRLKKSKLHMEKTGDKLDAARETLAAQKPIKRPGPLKLLGRAARAEARKYVHGKIHQVERENVGVEAAHKAELAGERVVRGTSRFVKRRIRTRPARQVRKLQKREISARADYAFRKLAQEHPELKHNAVSRYFQKRRIRKQYQKQAREAARQGKKAVKITEKITRAVWAFVRSNPKVILIGLAVFLLVVLLQSCMASLVSIGNGVMGAIGGTSYLAEDVDINDADLAYTEWETDLLLEAKNAPHSHPGYDEYRFELDAVGHDPHALIAFLTAKYDDFTFAGVEPVLRDIFNQQYELTFTEIVEVRYRTEYYTDEDGDEHSYEVPYNWYILVTKLTARPFTEVIEPLLDTQEARDRYEVYMLLKGNRQYVGSPFPFNWRPYVASFFGYRVHPITGERDFHRGIDIALPMGTEILAGGDGVVVEATTHSLYGLTVKIAYGDSVAARYSHCSALLVSAGQTVQAGDVIAHVGSTGNSTGPHLDMEVTKDGELLNPLYFVVIPFE